jgi:hypothetical protein
LTLSTADYLYRIKRALDTSSKGYARCGITRSARVLIATGSMNHELHNKLKQINWKFRRHKTVNVIWSVQLGIRLKEDNNVGMRKTMLLKFNGIEIGSQFPQDTPFDVPNK